MIIVIKIFCINCVICLLKSNRNIFVSKPDEIYLSQIKFLFMSKKISFETNKILFISNKILFDPSKVLIVPNKVLFITIKIYLSQIKSQIKFYLPKIKS